MRSRRLEVVRPSRSPTSAASSSLRPRRGRPSSSSASANWRCSDQFVRIRRSRAGSRGVAPALCGDRGAHEHRRRLWSRARRIGARRRRSSAATAGVGRRVDACGAGVRRIAAARARTCAARARTCGRVRPPSRLSAAGRSPEAHRRRGARGSRARRVRARVQRRLGRRRQRRRRRVPAAPRPAGAVAGVAAGSGSRALERRSAAPLVSRPSTVPVRRRGRRSRMARPAAGRRPAVRPGGSGSAGRGRGGRDSRGAAATDSILVLMPRVCRDVRPAGASRSMKMRSSLFARLAASRGLRPRRSDRAPSCARTSPRASAVRPSAVDSARTAAAAARAPRVLRSAFVSCSASISRMSSWSGQRSANSFSARNASSSLPAFCMRSAYSRKFGFASPLNPLAALILPSL